MSLLDDQTLIKKYKSTGDISFLGELYQRYMHLIYGVCLKYLKNKQDSQDAVMAVFEKIVIDLKKHDVTNFKSWLHVAAKNFCLMKLRSASYKRELTHAEIDNDSGMELSLPLHHTEEDIESDLQILEKCIEELKEEQRKSVRMFFIDQKCYQEIVEATGFELKKVKSYIQNGKRNLRLCVEREREQN